MKILSLGTAAVVLLGGATARAGDVTVELTGVQARGGTMLVALQREGEFMRETSAYGARVENPGGGVLRLTLSNVAPGEYALSALHDQNGDGRMNLSAQFIPEEGWAMSRGEALRARPTFDQVKVTVPPGGTTLRASVIYYDGKPPAN